MVDAENGNWGEITQAPPKINQNPDGGREVSMDGVSGHRHARTSAATPSYLMGDFSITLAGRRSDMLPGCTEETVDFLLVRHCRRSAVFGDGECCYSVCILGRCMKVFVELNPT